MPRPLSITLTVNPARCNSTAANKPAIPAPTTRTSDVGAEPDEALLVGDETLDATPPVWTGAAVAQPHTVQRGPHRRAPVEACPWVVGNLPGSEGRRFSPDPIPKPES